MHPETVKKSFIEFPGGQCNFIRWVRILQSPSLLCGLSKLRGGESYLDQRGQGSRQEIHFWLRLYTAEK